VYGKMVALKSCLLAAAIALQLVSGHGADARALRVRRARGARAGGSGDDGHKQLCGMADKIKQYMGLELARDSEKSFDKFDYFLGGGSVGSQADKKGSSSAIVVQPMGSGSVNSGGGSLAGDSDVAGFGNFGAGSFGSVRVGKLKVGDNTETVVVKDLSTMKVGYNKNRQQEIQQAMADMELVAGMSVCSSRFPCVDAPVVTYKGSSKLGDYPGAVTDIYLEPVFWDGKKETADVLAFFDGKLRPRNAWARFASWASPISPAGSQLFNLDAALVFAQQVLLGLGFLEARAALRHHDLWHPNIMFGDGGLVKIIDLGMPCQYNPGKDLVFSGLKAYSNSQCTYNSVAYGAFNLACASPVLNDDGQGCKRGRPEMLSPVIDALCDSAGEKWRECQINLDCKVSWKRGAVLGRFASASIDLYPTGLILFDFILGHAKFSFNSLFIDTLSDKDVSRDAVKTSLLPHFLSLSDKEDKQQKTTLTNRARVQARMAAIITHSLHERDRKKQDHIFPQAPVAALFVNDKAKVHCIAVVKGAQSTIAFGIRNTAGACDAVPDQKSAEEAAYRELVSGGADKGTAGLLDLLVNLLTPRGAAGAPTQRRRKPHGPIQIDRLDAHQHCPSVRP
jgi:hypothetical protein